MERIRTPLRAVGVVLIPVDAGRGSGRVEAEGFRGPVACERTVAVWWEVGAQVHPRILGSSADVVLLLAELVVEGHTGRMDSNVRL